MRHSALSSKWGARLDVGTERDGPAVGERIAGTVAPRRPKLVEDTKTSRKSGAVMIGVDSECRVIGAEESRRW
jgi:hypothetical protein